MRRDFPGNPVVKDFCAPTAGGKGSTPGQGTKISQGVQCNPFKKVIFRMRKTGL